MNATTKTVIDEIRARLVYGIHLVQDAKTLLAILAEVEALPDEWLGLHPTNAISQTQYDAAITAIRICVDQLKAILKRVQT